jgi:acyl dehydratase
MSVDYQVITPDALELLRIGESWGTLTHTVTDAWVREYAVTIRDSNPLWFDEDHATSAGGFRFQYCPAAFVTALNPAERAQISPQEQFFGRLRGLPEGQGSWGFAAYNEVEYFDRPIKVGETVELDVSVSRAYEKQSRGAVLVFVDVVYDIEGEDGAKIARATAGIAQRFEQK